MLIVDRFGQPYGKGSRIAVATVSGRSPNLVLATVLEIVTEDKDGNPLTDRGTPTWKVKARPFSSGRGFTRWGGGLCVRLPSGAEFYAGVRSVTYAELGNIVVVDPNIYHEMRDEALKVNAQVDIYPLS